VNPLDTKKYQDMVQMGNDRCNWLPASSAAAKSGELGGGAGSAKR